MPGQPHTTMVHGDFKQGNFFFRGEGAETEFAAIDWQRAAAGTLPLDALSTLGRQLRG